MKRRKKLKGHKSEAAFFKDTSNFFSLLNLRSLIERFGLPRILWEGEREKFIKYVKAEMNIIHDTEKYMSGVLNNLLCTHCLNNFMKEFFFSRKPQSPKLGNLRFIAIAKNLSTTLLLGKFFRLF
jgi:hypothetical protein